MTAELERAVKELLDWLPIYSKNSSGYMRRLAVEKALSESVESVDPPLGLCEFTHEPHPEYPDCANWRKLKP